MIPLWPISLPQRFDRQGYGDETGDGRLRTKTSTGPGKSRLRSRAVPDRISGRMTMRGAQRLSLIAFLRDDLGGGVMPFTFPDPHDAESAILCQFGEALPKWSNPAGDWWVATLELEKLWTGAFRFGLDFPDLPPGYAYIVHRGAYMLRNGQPMIQLVSA